MNVPQVTIPSICHTPTPSEILKRAAQILSNPDNWTQQAFARTEVGAAVEPDSPKAHSFCAVGAIRRAYTDATGDAGVDWYKTELIYAAITRVLSLIGMSVVTWNDMDAKHADVLRVLKEAAGAEV